MLASTALRAFRGLADLRRDGGPAALLAHLPSRDGRRRRVLRALRPCGVLGLWLRSHILLLWKSRFCFAGFFSPVTVCATSSESIQRGPQKEHAIPMELVQNAYAVCVIRGYSRDLYTGPVAE